MNKRVKISLLVSVLILLILSVAGWYIYDYFREPTSKELRQYTVIYKAPKLLKAGHLNKGNWSIIQTPEYSEQGKTYFRNKQEFFEKFGEAEIGKDHIVTYDGTYTYPRNVSREKARSDQGMLDFKLYVYKIGENDQPPIALKMIDLFAYPELEKKGSLYYLLGISKNDRYIIVNHVKDDGPSKGHLYIDLKDYSLKIENDVPKEYQYKAPDYREFRAFKTVGSINDYTTFFAINNLEMVIDGEKKPKFFEKYPEAKEYMGEGKMMILDCSQATREDKLELTQLLEVPFLLETKN